MMFVTPSRPVRRRLEFGSVSARKRPRYNAWRNANFQYKTFNRRTTRGPRTTGPLRLQVKSLQRVVKNLAPEKKYLDTSVAATDIPTTGSVVHISALSQGDTQSTRTGSTVNVTDVSVSGTFLRNATDFGASAYARIAIVVDKDQVADTSPAAGDIFRSAADPTDTLPNVGNLERFRILYVSPLYDAWRMTLDSDLLAAVAPTQSTLFSYQTRVNIKVSYNGTAGTDIQKNGIYVVFISNIATLDFSGIARIGYTDV